MRKVAFAADLRFDASTSAIGVLRTTRGTLLSGIACPPGTHTLAQASTCWPTRRTVGEVNADDTIPPAFFADKPHMAVDERSSGTGAGNVYVTWTEFDLSSPFPSVIKMVACNNTLVTCSPPLLISGTDTDTQFSHVAIRPSGAITVTWINVTGTPSNPVFNIKYRSCGPAVPPAAPICGATSLVAAETQPIPFDGFLGAQDFRIATYPKHDHRIDQNGIETYVVWDRCKVEPVFGSLCPDADVVMKASANNGATWSALTCVDCSAQDQFFPWLRTDRSRNIVNIVYYTSVADPVFQHRVQVFLRHINPGLGTPNLPSDTHVLTTVLDDPNGDLLLGGFFFGDYIGVAARGTGADGSSRAYAHYTYNTVQGIYNGISNPEQNNHLSRVDY